MSASRWARFDVNRVSTPCFVIDEIQLADNLRILDQVQVQGGARILLALKAFASRCVAPLLMQTLGGTAASGLFEARLGRQGFGGELHTFCVAFREDELAEVLELSDHVIFNSASQWQRFGAAAQDAAVSCGLRVNPRCGAAPQVMYDPCQPRSRLGVVAESLGELVTDGLSGVHVHALCEQGLPALERAVTAVEQQFAPLLERAQWLNLGGGHLITAPGYDVAGLIRLVDTLTQRYDVQIYLEPGEAVVLNAGILVSEVLDTTWNEGSIAILDASPTCHTPDVLEAPYRPEILHAGEPGSRDHDYRLAGATCLAGDVFGDYSFANPLGIGDRIVFLDQAPYTIVKTNSFNGIPLPSIAVWNSATDELREIERFGYVEYAGRLR